MNIRLGNLALSEVVSPEALVQIKNYLEENGFKWTPSCNELTKEDGNFHIFDMPRLIEICGKEKMDNFIEFLRENDLVGSGFIGRVGVTYCDKSN